MVNQGVSNPWRKLQIESSDPSSSLILKRHIESVSNQSYFFLNTTIIIFYDSFDIVYVPFQNEEMIEQRERK